MGRAARRSGVDGVAGGGGHVEGMDDRTVEEMQTIPTYLVV